MQRTEFVWSIDAPNVGCDARRKHEIELEQSIVATAQIRPRETVQNGRQDRGVKTKSRRWQMRSGRN
jgi:hypothetical protein